MLTADVTASGADIIVVTESHFKSRHDNTVSNIDGFNCFRLDLVKRKGGGMCVYTGLYLMLLVFSLIGH